MPRRTKLKHRGGRAKGLKRPRAWHHGANRDDHLAEAQRRFDAAARSAA